MGRSVTDDDFYYCQRCQTLTSTPHSHKEKSMIVPQTLMVQAGGVMLRVEVTQDRYDEDRHFQRLSVYDHVANTKLAECVDLVTED